MDKPEDMKKHIFGLNSFVEEAFCWYNILCGGLHKKLTFEEVLQE
jgi:hypothetical protein